ncbi:MAG: hypothetical protein JXR64_11870, partial [Spirochaetales bacterium]|nr:hypothetical protein [Spirochaetales bacterium]
MRKKLLPIILLLTFTSCSLLDLLNKNDEPETFSDSVSTDGLPTEGIHAYLLLTNPKEESITSPGITYNGATS